MKRKTAVNIVKIIFCLTVEYQLVLQDQRPEEMMTHQALPAGSIQHPELRTWQAYIPSNLLCRLFIDYWSSFTSSPSVVVSIKRTRRLTILKKTWFFSFPILYKYREKETFFCFHLSMGTWPSFFLSLWLYSISPWMDKMGVSESAPFENHPLPSCPSVRSGWSLVDCCRWARVYGRDLMGFLFFFFSILLLLFSLKITKKIRRTLKQWRDCLSICSRRVVCLWFFDLKFHSFVFQFSFL